MVVTNDIKYVGVNDHKIDLFESQYDVPLGMAYNSYVILDDKIAVIDSVEGGFFEEWKSNIEAVTGGRRPDYLIVQHMEPDHSSSIAKFMEAYPEAVVVAGKKAFPMMNQFYGNDYAERRIVVGEGDTLELGSHTLSFITAAMVHWPEVIMTYDSKDKVFFSADAFGKFGANDVEDTDDWACEARRYYFGIVGKYGKQVQMVLKKAAALDIEIICSLHGPVLSDNIKYYLDIYNTWSSYEAESEGVFIAYTSVYGNTRKAVELLAKKLEEKGCPHVSFVDLARGDMAECVEDAFRYDRLVLATTTYNADIFPFMRHYIDDLAERGFTNRTIGLIENGSWAPTAAKVMRGKLEGLKNITLTETTVTIKSALNEESMAQIDALADELMK